MTFPRRAPRKASDDLIPLINVVFLLLIFFMLAGTMRKPDLWAVIPPVSRSEAVAEGGALTVLIAGNGRIALGGREVDRADLTRMVAERVRAGAAARITLKADAAAKAGDVIPIMEDLRAAGVTALDLVTEARW